MDRLAVALVACIILAGCGATVGPTTPGEGTPARVTAVTDGDTVEIRYANGSSETVRLVGIDTPEVHIETAPTEFEGVPDTDAGRACLREWGERASAYTTRELAGKSVRVALDPAEGPRGSYGRLLAYVRVDGRSVNYRLVAEGYARIYDSGFSLQSRYLAAEAAAQANATGVWSCARTPATSSTPDGSGGPIAIVTVRADPPGDDTEALNGEYVVLENVGNESVALAGWTLTDEADHTYVFDNRTMAPGDRVTIHTGSGTDSATDLYWGQSGAVWNNGGDVATVADADGTVVARYRY